MKRSSKSPSLAQIADTDSAFAIIETGIAEAVAAIIASRRKPRTKTGAAHAA